MSYSLAVDVSSYQSGFDFNKVHNSVPLGNALYQISEMIIKVSEGNHYLDPTAITFLNGCVDKGIYHGYYHFMKPILEVDGAKKEAAFFISALQKLNIPAKIGYWLDLEVNPNNLSKEDYTDYIEDFISVLVGAGYGNIGIYGGASFLNTNLMSAHELGRFPLWIAEYCFESQIVIPNGWKTWLKWQFTGNGKVPAFNGNIDLSFVKPTLDIG